MACSGVAERPFAPFSTRKSVMPPVSPADPDVRAATIRRSAAAPSGMKRFLPVRTKPAPVFVAAMATEAGLWCAPSSTASAATASPEAIFGSQAVFCASLPPSIRAEAPTSAEACKGEAASVRPVSSSTRPMARTPSSDPPKASGMITPVQPISAICAKLAAS